MPSRYINTNGLLEEFGHYDRPIMKTRLTAIRIAKRLRHAGERANRDLALVGSSVRHLLLCGCCLGPVARSPIGLKAFCIVANMGAV